MARLPIPGSDDGTWGDILNEFLSVSLASDGTVKSTEAVKLTGDQTIAGVKTFSSSPVLPGDPTTGLQAATKDYVDTIISLHTADTTSVHGITDTSALETTTGAQAKADAKVDDTAYDATTWNGVTGIAPSKNAVRDKIESLEQLAASSTTSLDTSTPGQVAIEVNAEDVQDYTSGTNNYTAPTWATTLEVILVGPGGSGGSGRCDVTNTIRGGGGGGGHGEVVRMSFKRADLTYPVSCTVGTAGTPGASVSTTATDGNAGAAGTNTTFGTYMTARAGAPGAGGTGAVGGAGGANTQASMFIGMDGAKGGGDSAATSLANATGIGGGGGGGMGMTASSNTISAGSNGGLYTSGTPGAAGLSNFAGAAGSNGIYWSMGGGGGGRNTTGSAVVGGAGGTPGGGGGGGGAALFGQANGSGSGGLGGAGFIRIIARR